jgi:hypothetical protein
MFFKLLLKFFLHSLPVSLLISNASFVHASSNWSSSYLFNKLHLSAPGLKASALKSALRAYETAQSHHLVKKPILTVIDYSLPSSKQRMWVFDLKKQRLVLNTYVAHGQNSGLSTATRFSNQPSSKSSSLGTFITRDSYSGHNGLSLNLQGLERGFNDNALNRRVVIHGAWYMEPSFIRSTGRAGRSWGCPAVAQSIASSLINQIKGGSVVFAYYPDSRYLNASHYA